MRNYVKIKFFKQLIDNGTLDVTCTGVVTNTITNRQIGTGKSTGYHLVSFLDKDTRKIWSIGVHVLVWLKYKGSIPQGLQLNHKDLDRCNNKLSNLELVTHSGNWHHAAAAGRRGPSFKKGNKMHLLRNSVGNRYTKR